MILVHFENDEGTYGFETQQELDEYVERASKKIEYQEDDGKSKSEYKEGSGIYLYEVGYTENSFSRKL